MVYYDAIDRLMSLRVGDVMTKNVIILQPTQTLAEAARLFAQADVSAAPVVDEFGKCVGMLSATDFARRHAPSTVGEESCSPERHELVHDDEGWRIEARPQDWVASCMTEGVRSVEQDASLIAAARVLCNQHLHRLPVLEKGRPVGILSTMDVVAAVVNAVDEMGGSAT